MAVYGSFSNPHYFIFLYLNFLFTQASFVSRARNGFLTKQVDIVRTCAALIFMVRAKEGRKARRLISKLGWDYRSCSIILISGGIQFKRNSKVFFGILFCIVLIQNLDIYFMWAVPEYFNFEKRNWKEGSNLQAQHLII